MMANAHFTTSHLLFMAQGVVWTVVLSAMAFGGGGLVGFLVALARISPFAAIRVATGTYIQLVQGMPLLIIMFLSYFGLAAIGLKLSPMMAAGASLTIYVGAYLGEIWRGCLESVPKAQWEAAECLALTKTQRLFKVVLPQAIHIATPPTVGFMVQIIKSTSLASVIGFVELARSGQIINNSIFEPFLIYSIVAVAYFALCYPVSIWSRRLEKRSGFAHAAKPAVS
jgi:polar amino acid transport system permease protein